MAKVDELGGNFSIGASLFGALAEPIDCGQKRLNLYARSCTFPRPQFHFAMISNICLDVKH